jgi:hypothetical protein
MLLSLLHEKIPFVLVIEIFKYIKNNNLLDDIKDYYNTYNSLINDEYKLSKLSNVNLYSSDIIYLNPFYFKKYTNYKLLIQLLNIIKYEYGDIMTRIFKFKNLNNNLSYNIFDFNVDYLKIKLKYKNNEKKCLNKLRLIIGNLNILERKKILQLLLSTPEKAWNISKQIYLDTLNNI